MNEIQPTARAEEYRCPGERQSISRSVHLGRLAAFFPACRDCPHREETGSLSPRQVEQLAETAEQRRSRPLFHDEGAGGVFLDDLAPADARRIAAAFGAMTRREDAAAIASQITNVVNNSRGLTAPGMCSTGEISHRGLLAPGYCDITCLTVNKLPSFPLVVLAGDGRPMSAELTAAAADGLRWSGCEVVDIGPATAACLAFAVHQLQAAGGVSIGNPGFAPHEAGMQFWLSGPRPLSADCGLESLAQLAETNLIRPTRSYGPMRRFQADKPYLAAIAEHYHALRPLRVAVDSASNPALDYLQRLCAAVACEIVPSRTGDVSPSPAHFAVQIDGDGETCRVFDERGRNVPPERLLPLLARYIRNDAEQHVGGDSHRRSNNFPHSLPPSATGVASHKSVVVLGNDSPRAIAERLERLGMRPVTCGSRRAEIADAMRENSAALGFGPGNRCWHSPAGTPLPDALMTVTRLLEILSRGDEPLSEVLDRDAPAV